MTRLMMTVVSMDDNLEDGTVTDCLPGRRWKCPTVLMITLAVMMMMMDTVMVMMVAVMMMMVAVVMVTVVMMAPARSEVEVPQEAQSFSQAMVDLPRSGSS